MPCAAGEADEPVVQLFQQTLVERRVRRRLRFFPWQTRIGVRRCEQPAEVRVSPGRLDEQRDVRAVRERHLGTGDRPDAEVLGGVRELQRAVDAVMVGERERGIAELRGANGELFRQRRTVEKRVRRVRVQLDVLHGLRPTVRTLWL